MSKNLFLFVFLFIISGSYSFAQFYRSEGMGGLTYSIIDNHHSLSIYDFGQNPAGLYDDEQTSQLSATPSYNNTWGGYRRKYDPQGDHIYSVGFTGIKTLGTSGTFFGQTNYSYDERSDVLGNLRYNPYSGEGFFISDTNSGNIKYDGPKVCFMYSLQVLPDLLFGASAAYQILNGLKRVYANAEITYRDVSGKAGLAYRFSDYFTLGSTFELFDNQESISSESIDLTDVEIWNYRGDKLAVKQRNKKVAEKTKASGWRYGLQALLRPIDKLEIGFSGDYSNSKSNTLVPKSGLNEVEENYSAFEDYNIKIQARYHPAKQLIIGLNGGYYYNACWTKNSPLILKLWDWNVKETVLGVGASYSIIPECLLAGFEFEFSTTKADSSKFIDNDYSAPSSNNSLIRAGLEYQFSEDLIFRGGYNLKSEQIDFITGCKDAIISTMTFGVCLRYFNATEINFNVSYGNQYSKNSTELKRKSFNSFVELKLFSF